MPISVVSCAKSAPKISHPSSEDVLNGRQGSDNRGVATLKATAGTHLSADIDGLMVKWYLGIL